MFPLGGPVPPEHLVGRDTLIDQLAGWLAEGFRVLLTGPRRSGKSSVAEATAAHLRTHGILVALVDLSACATLREAAERVTAACAAWAAAVPPATTGEDRGPEAAFATALEQPERQAEALGTTACALVLDGCDHLERLGGMQALRRARPGLARLQRTAYLFAGVHGLQLGRLAGTRSAPFALPIGLRPPQPEAWYPYLQHQFVSIGWEAPEDGLADALAHTGGHPFDLMALCRAVAAAPGRRKRAVTADAVAQAVSTVGVLLQPLLLAEVAALGPVRHGILGRMACGAHIYREAGPPASIKRAMDELVAGGILRRGRRGEYAFTEPMLAEALRGGRR